MGEHQNEVLAAIETRRSVRRYRDESMPEADLRWILEAARIAPSAANRQPWSFVVVQEPDRRRKLAAACKNQMWMADAAAIVCACSLPEVTEKWHALDTMIAMEHIILAATSLGYGTCWIGAFVPEEVAAVLEIPPHMNIVALTPIGVPDETPDARPRRPFDDVFHMEKAG
jgi:nitroreductase